MTDSDSIPKIKTADEAVTCAPSGHHEITVQPGEGVDAITLQISRSGHGEGDACWSEARAEVIAVTGKIPQEGARVLIPNEMLETRDGK